MAQILVDTLADASQLEALARATGLNVALAEGDLDKPRELPEAALSDVRAILCTQLPKNHAAMKSLEFVQLSSAGFTQIENLGLASRGVRVATASGVNDVPIAEWGIMMMIALARDLPQMFRNQQAGVWDRGARFQSEVRGRTVGIWGYGGIGRETARLAKAIGLRVHVLTRSGTVSDAPRFSVGSGGEDVRAVPDRIFSGEQLAEFCADLDYLLLAMPLTPDNVGIVNRRIFEALPDRAFFLNPARGPLANEADLLWALESGKIAGAALDTHFKYPMPPDHPLWRMPNVIMTPHISGSSQSPHFRPRLWSLFAENVRRWQAGEAIANVLSARQMDPAIA